MTQDDLDQGSITNTATATATPPSAGAVTSNAATATVTLDGDAGDDGDSGQTGDQAPPGAAPTALPQTGVDQVLPFLAMGGALAVLVGMVLLLAARSRPRRDSATRA